MGKDNPKFFRNIKKLITISGIGEGIKLKEKLFNYYKSNTINLIFKNSHVSKYSIILKGKGIIILNNTVIKSFVKIDQNVFVNSNCVIGHHTHIKKNTSISMGVLIGGNSQIGENCFIGMGTKIFQNIKIGKNCIIGSNKLIKKNIPNNSKIY